MALMNLQAFDDDDPVYVAVSKNVCESEMTLLWALMNLRVVKKLFLLHVHEQISMTPSSSGLEQSEIDSIQASELASSKENLLKYCNICNICKEAGIIEQDVEISYTLANCVGDDKVGEGIVELIYENNIKKLVMGAAADSHYTEGMVDITSTKAKYVSHHAPHSCNLLLVCNGDLIQTGKGSIGLLDPSSSLHGFDSAPIPNEEAGRAEHEDQLICKKSSFFDIVTQIRKRKADEELNKAKAEIEDMKMIQEELTDQLYNDPPRMLGQDDDVMTTEELLRRLDLEDGPSQLPVSKEPPPHFLCPITQEVMQEPVFAADGFTYEAEAVKEWLDNGHETSPMTNMRLSHNNLVPNHNLRSAIQEWLQRNS